MIRNTQTRKENNGTPNKYKMVCQIVQMVKTKESKEMNERINEYKDSWMNQSIIDTAAKYLLELINVSELKSLCCAPLWDENCKEYKRLAEIGGCHICPEVLIDVAAGELVKLDKITVTLIEEGKEEGQENYIYQLK